MYVGESDGRVVTPFLDPWPRTESGRDVDMARLWRKDLALNVERFGIGYCSADLAILISARANHSALAGRPDKGVRIQRNRGKSLELGDLGECGWTRRGYQQKTVNGDGRVRGCVMQPENGT